MNTLLTGLILLVGVILCGVVIVSLPYLEAIA